MKGGRGPSDSSETDNLQLTAGGTHVSMRQLLERNMKSFEFKTYYPVECSKLHWLYSSAVKGVSDVRPTYEDIDDPVRAYGHLCRAPLIQSVQDTRRLWKKMVSRS